MLLLLALGCDGSKDGDSSAAVDTGVDTAETDTGETEETAEEDWCTFDDNLGEDSSTATITATVVGYDGSVPEGLEVQACQTSCIQAWTDATGTATFTGMKAGCYKLDALGERIQGADYGRIRVFLEVGIGEAHAVSAPLLLPQMVGPQTVSTGAHTFGNVTWTVDVATLAVPFGFADDQFSVGAVAGADVPAHWAITPAGAVAFQPLGTEVSAPFDLVVVGDYADGTYDVWSAGGHGELVGPVGTATAVGGTLTATGIAPEYLTWVLFSAQ